MVGLVTSSYACMYDASVVISTNKAIHYIVHVIRDDVQHAMSDCYACLGEVKACVLSRRDITCSNDICAMDSFGWGCPGIKALVKARYKKSKLLGWFSDELGNDALKWPSSEPCVCRPSHSGVVWGCAYFLFNSRVIKFLEPVSLIVTRSFPFFSGELRELSASLKGSTKKYYSLYPRKKHDIVALL